LELTSSAVEVEELEHISCAAERAAAAAEGLLARLEGGGSGHGGGGEGEDDGELHGDGWWSGGWWKWLRVWFGSEDG
jgi:hypothetical protein